MADLMALNAFLLLADEAPDFVKLQTAGADTDHHAIVQFGVPAPNALV